MTVFEKVSPENTAITLKIAFEKANELATDIVLPTNVGPSAFAAIEMADKVGFKGKIIVVTHVWGFRNPEENELSDADRKKLEDLGAIVITAAHTLSGVERALSGKFNGVYPVEIMAYTLRMFCQGVKVCVELGAMALDAGALRQIRPVVCLGGTGRGLDTACVMTPSYSAKIFDTRVHEILCKPY